MATGAAARHVARHPRASAGRRRLRRGVRAPAAAAAEGAAAAAAEAAAAWAAADPCAATAAEMKALLARAEAGDDAAVEEIASRMEPRIAFGTAGLRAEVGAGAARMNDLVVLQTTQGLCEYVLQDAADPEAAKEQGVVVGFDGRADSARFAWLAAEVLLSRGVRVYLLGSGEGEALPSTPLAAFAVAHLGAAAGVMVTASHNPKEYNGYKVWWANGCQIIPPQDAGIAAAIDANLELWPRPPEAELRASPLLSDPSAEVAEAYYAKVVADACFHRGEYAGATPVAYTPLHGVGLPWARRAFDDFALAPFVPVAAQAEPDAEFPTVTFPNPEEGRATWKLSFETADAAGATIALANDPDADRLAAAERVADPAPEGGDAHWRSFTGNEIGALLGHWVWSQWRARNQAADPSKVAMLASAVSSKFLRAMAEKEGFRFEETLTGFKWLGNRAFELEAEGYTILFAYEEAIGFMFGGVHKDKDGVAAAAAFAEMAAHVRATTGRSVSEHLAWLYDTYGCFREANGYFIAAQPAASRALFDDMRADVGYPTKVGPLEVTGVRDLGTGRDDAAPGGEATLPWTPGDMMVTFTLGDVGTLTLRASGTEPKLKYYIETQSSDASEAELLASQVEDAVWAEIVCRREGISRRP